MSIWHWLLEWREPTRWIAYVVQIALGSHVARRRLAARSGAPRRSLWASLIAIANLIGEAGAAPPLLALERLKRARDGAEARTTIAAQAETITELTSQLSALARSKGLPSPSPTSASQPPNDSTPKR